ncbi:MAG: LLM class flavin-dependent oxidoreductase [Mycobacterium sp.]
MSSQMHLNLNLRGIGFHRAAWRHSTAQPTEVCSLPYYTRIVQAAEKAKLDAVFLADSPRVYSDREPLAMSNEPLTLLAALAAQTSQIGLIGTISTTYNDPYEVALRFASLDHLSGGRIGMNFVTSSGDPMARNFGYDSHPDFELRYERASEFVDVVLDLWSGEHVAHHGRFFDVDGRLPIAPSPQGFPVLVQAGASDRGRDMAALRAEAVYTGSSTIPNGLEFYDDVKARLAKFGRSPHSAKILPGVVPYIGSTEAEGKALEAELEDLATKNVDVVGQLGAELGVDFSVYDLDGPFPLEAFPSPTRFKGGQSRLNRLRTWVQQENLSIRELAIKVEKGLNNVHWTTAGSAEQIADELESWFRAGAADGFNILVPLHPKGTLDFTEQVVPILQQRGLFRTEYDGTTLSDHFELTPELRPNRRTVRSAR